MFSQMTTTSQGSVGVAMAIAAFSKKGMVVSIPLNDNQPYDLVVEEDGVLKKVQVKTTRYKDRRTDYYTVQLRSTKGTTKGNKSKLFDADKVDYLYIFTADHKEYLIPAAEVTAKNSLALNSNADRWRLQQGVA